jgi:predicted CXXCH cytochrome family protein
MRKFLPTAAIATMLFLTTDSIRCTAAVHSLPGAVNRPSMGPCTFAEQVQHDWRAQQAWTLSLEQGATGNAEDGQQGNQAMAGERTTGEMSTFWSWLTSASYHRGSHDGRIQALDRFTLGCIGCHDGVSAGNIDVVVRDDRWSRQDRSVSADRGLLQKSHPIGMQYYAYLTSGATAGRYKQIQGNGSLRLIDGRVGCLTCHDPLSREPKLLSMSDNRSALCLSCHNT